jgi:diguanylate cyclase (GGDEF)-like protein
MCITTKNCSSRVFLVACCLVFFCFFSYSLVAETSIRFIHMGAREGLVNLGVSALVQDKTGFIWVGTQGGLQRWDGKSFTLYENEPFNTNTIPHNQIQTLFLDTDGKTLWIGTYGGLAKLDTKTDFISTWSHEPTRSESLCNNTVVSIGRDAEGRLWVGTLDGLDRKEGDTFIHYRTGKNKEGKIESSLIRSLLLDSRGDFWVGTGEGGFYKYLLETDSFKAYRKSNLPGKEIFSDQVFSIKEDQDGYLWLGLWGFGLTRFDTKTEETKNYPLADSRVYFVNTEEQGFVRAGTWGGGYFELATDSEEIKQFRKDDDSLWSLSNNTVYSMLYDTAGNIWVGTNGGGFALVLKESPAYSLYEHDPKKTGSRSSGRTLSILEDSKNRLWIGSYNTGLNRLDPGETDFVHYVHNPENRKSLPNDIVGKVFEDSKGIIWIATNQGLARYNEEDDNFDVILHDPQNPFSLADNTVQNIIEEKETGNLWFATYNKGLEYWNREENIFYHFAYDSENPTSISNNLTLALAYDAQNRLWVGTSQGLCRYEGDGIFTRYVMDMHNPRSLPSSNIRWLHTSSDNCLWIATDSGGIAVYDEESDSFSHWTKKDGLISNSIFSMVEDNNKNIWAVSANGISIWDYTTKSWRQYLDHTRLRVSFALKNRIVELSEVKMQLESVNVKLETLAKKDGLTGVNNRRALTTELKQRFEEAVLLFEPIAALMIDIDFFKLYNDYYGHQKGDEALIAVARTLKNSLDRPKDSVSRYGGEEFIVLLPSTDHVGAKVIAERMRLAVENLEIPHIVSSVKKDITISVGYASYIPRRGEEMTTIIDMADRALYRAKDAGRNCISS